MAEYHTLILFLVSTLLAGGKIGHVLAMSDALTDYVSAVGDPGMRRDALRLALESWNQCNEVGKETPQMGSPRYADCFDVYKASPKPNGWSYVLVN